MVGKKKIDYTTTPVYMYRFVCNDPTIINTYAGSTINMTTRKCNHKSSCNNINSKCYHLLVYKIIRENGGWSNWKMLQLESIFVKDKPEAKRREQYWIEYYHAEMNMRNAKQDETHYLDYHRNYYQNNKEILAEHQREYNQKNKDKINERGREYYQRNKEKIAEQQREYKQENKKKIAEYNREYYQENKNKVAEQKREYYQRKKQLKLINLTPDTNQ